MHLVPYRYLSLCATARPFPNHVWGAAQGSCNITVARTSDPPPDLGGAEVVTEIQGHILPERDAGEAHLAVMQLTVWWPQEGWDGDGGVMCLLLGFVENDYSEADVFALLTSNDTKPEERVDLDAPWWTDGLDHGEGNRVYTLVPAYADFEMYDAIESVMRDYRANYELLNDEMMMRSCDPPTNARGHGEPSAPSRAVPSLGA